MKVSSLRLKARLVHIQEETALKAGWGRSAGKGKFRAELGKDENSGVGEGMS